MAESSLSGNWKINWINSPQDFTGKKRVAFLSSPLYRYLQNEDFALDIGLITSGREESLAFRFFVGGSLVEEQFLPVGSFLHQALDNNLIQVTILQNSNEQFQKISILRLGPQLNQRSCEHYFIDDDGSLRVAIMASDSKGEVATVRRVFTRKAGSSPQQATLRKFSKTLGWDCLKFWPGMVLELCQMKIMKTTRTKLASLESETIWSIDLPVDAIRRINFDSGGDPYRIDYWIQVGIGAKSWTISIAQDCLVALNDLVRYQNTVPSAVDSVFKRLSPQLAWKNYVELHRHILQLDGMFRVFIQHFEDLAQNAVDALCSILEIPQNIDEEQIKYFEMAIEMATEVDESSNLNSSSFRKVQSINRLRSFTSFRLDVVSESKSRYPSMVIEDDAQRIPPVSAISEDFLDQRVTAVGSTEVFSDLSRDKIIRPSLSHTPLQSFVLSKDDQSSHPHVSSGVELKGDGGIANHSSTEIMPDPKPPTSLMTGKRAIQEIVHRSSVHSHGGRGIRGSLGRNEPFKILEDHRQSWNEGEVTSAVALVVNREATLGGESHMSEMAREPVNVQYSDVYHDGGVALKYLPLEMVNAPKVKNSIARGLLFDRLGEGMIVIKHGRQGKPKKKILKCDPAVSVLWMYSESINSKLDTFADGKEVLLKDIIDVRLGTEIDPNAIDNNIALPPGHSAAGSAMTKKLFQKTSSAFSSLFSKSDSKSSPDNMYGSAVLRRNCTAEELSLSFSFILHDRTLDIQCMSKEDFVFLTVNFIEIIKHQATPSVRSETGDGNIEGFEENPLKKKLRAPGLTGVVGALSDASAMSEQPRLQKRVGSKKSVQFLDNIAERNEPCDNEVEFDTYNDDIHEIDESVDFFVDPDTQFIESLRMSSTEALQIGLILTDQERKYGTNMYQSIEPVDKSKIEMYVDKGFTMEEAILRVFEKKYVPVHMQTRLGPNSLEDELSEDDEKDPAPSSKHLQGKKKSSFLRNLFDEIDERAIGRSNNPVSRSDKGTLSGLSSRLRSTDALQIGLLLSQQETSYNTNMYESLQPQDAKEIRRLIDDEEKSIDDAILEIFNKKYNSSQDSLDNVAISEETPVNGLAIGADDGKGYTASSDVVDTNSQAEDKMDEIVKLQGTSFDSVNQVGPEKPQDEKETLPVTIPARTGSSFFPNSASVLPPSNPPGSLPPPRSIPRMDSTEAVQMAMMLSEQEDKYGVNMFDSLRPTDEPEIERLVSIGYTLEQAVYALFEQKYIQAEPDITEQSHAVDISEIVEVSSARTSEHSSSDSQMHGFQGGPQNSVPQPLDPAWATGGAFPPHYQSATFQQPSNYPYPQQFYPPYGNYPGVPQQQQQQQLYAQYVQQQQLYAQQYYYGGYSAGVPIPQQQQQMFAVQSQHGYYGQNAGIYQQNRHVQQTMVDPRQIPVAASPYHAPNSVNREQTYPEQKTDRPGLMRRASTTIFGRGDKKTGGIKESDVKTIVNMGFTRDQAISALSATDGNLLAAIDSITR